MSMQINRSPIVWRTDQPTPRSPAKSFLPLLRAAVASHPGRPDLLCDLVIVLRDDRRWDEIFDLLSPLADGDGLTPALACELARAAIAGERPDIALRVVDSAIAQGVEGAARQKVLALYALCRFDEAQAAAQQALREDPDDNLVLGAFGSDCLTRGDLDALISTCQWGIDCGASSSAYMAYLATALAMAGRRSELGDVLDPAHLCQGNEFRLTR
ncbi:hypothetical protein GCM10011505_27630 [Tistrella bauzanensis]|uniref:Tetratricopeptide repeat protein n=1 Tax=Tistrella bauzanensis TaxID=657419 RepID=A0ABQ1IJT1_9PROT|nr:hypothetical protein [Tistrella bauzanensis]GGB44788.1 hypothetical protein GCM10011505_27630 [Tistrella bauzanensis]